MIEIPTLKDVQAAWTAFSNLQPPWCDSENRGGAPMFIYKQREAAWQRYAKLRDHYLYSIKVISLNELNSQWHPRVSGYMTRNRV